MKLSYYPDTDSLYIDLSETPSVESREISEGVVLDYDEAGNVVGIDIDIRPHNRQAIEEHPLADAITLIEGSSIDQGTVDAVRDQIKGAQRVMVVLDSMHTADHVLRELGQALQPVREQLRRFCQRQLADIRIAGLLHEVEEAGPIADRARLG